MKILIEVGRLSRGGAERVASLWANGFSRRGNEVTLVINARAIKTENYPIDKAIKVKNVYSWIGMKLFWFFHFHWFMIWRLRRIIKEIKPDVIICVLQPWAEWSRKAIKGYNIPIINTEHNAFERPDDAPLSKLERKRKYEFNKKYAHVTVLTNSDSKCVEGILQNISVMPNPLAFTPVINLPPKDKIILAAGRLGAWHYKGFDLLIKAWGMIAKKNPEWKLQICGQGKKEAKKLLTDMATKENLGTQLEFLGFQNDMLPIYQRASIFALSSRYEAFGMVLIEAMSQGCAPIACDYMGRQRDIITSKNEGLICPVDDAEALANAIQYLIENDEYRLIVQHGAVERSKYYTLDNVMNRWDVILNNIVK